MTVTTIYASPTQTSKKIATAVGGELAKVLGGEQKEVSITLLKERKGLQLQFTKDDIVVLALPVYGGRIPLFLEDTVNAIKGNNTPIVVLGVYGNRDFDDALLEMKNVTAENGFIPVAAGAFIGEHSFSEKLAQARPDEKDLAIAREFGAKAGALLKDGKELKTVEVTGNFPYKERGPAAPVAPKTTDDCFDCMLCAQGCPTEAISFTDPRVTDPNKCVKCNYCVKICPVKAKTFDGALDGPTTWLLENFSDRSEPQLFI